MSIERDKWLYVYTRTAQRAREFFGLPPNAEVRLSQEQIEGALPCWAIKVPPPSQLAKESHWSDKGKIRLECRLCDAQHDEITDFPPNWTDIQEIRSWERATAPVPFEPNGRNEYGDSVLDWQTHFGICPDCRQDAKVYAEEPQPPPPAVKPNRKELSNRELAIAARGHLFHNGGFTLDEYGESATGDLWAVSVPGKEQKFSGSLSIDEIKAYLDRYCPVVVAHFGGWYDKKENVTYLDHTELYAHKHTAIQKGLEYRQKAIYNLKTRETIDLTGATSNLRPLAEREKL